MALENSDTRRPVELCQAVLIVGGIFSLIFGFVWMPHGTGYTIFAGLCFVAAAIRESAVKIRRDR